MLTLPDRPNYDCEGIVQEDREVFILNLQIQCDALRYLLLLIFFK